MGAKSLKFAMNRKTLPLQFVGFSDGRAKIEAGKMVLDVEFFRLDEVVEKLADIFCAELSSKNVEMILDIASDVPLLLKGDPLRLSQILNNLAGNAVKFTEEGEISVRVECVEKSDERVRLKFTVRDTGIGIAPEQSEKLFAAFTQSDSSTTRKYGCAGLGLAISKRLSELMDG